MRINYVTLADESLASYRYRIKIPAIFLKRKGHDVSISKDIRLDAQVCLFSKHFDPTDPEKAERCREYAIPVVFDICDLHENLHKPHYEKMSDLADKITVPTDALRDCLNGRNAIVIPEPYEYAESEPEFKPRNEEQLRILWFGHAVNLQALVDNWEAVKGHYLLVISNPEAQAFTNMRITPWSIQTVSKGLSECDIVVIPVENTLKKQVKSANRLIESIRRGKFVVASSTPAHDEFKDLMFIGDINEGISWVLKNKSEIEGRIKAAQDYIRDRFSPERIAEKWENALCRT